jgi:hypothetical protein
MSENLQNKSDHHRTLEKGEAFDLYVRRIGHNLASLLEQLVLLQGIVRRKQEPPAAKSGTSTDFRP